MIWVLLNTTNQQQEWIGRKKQNITDVDRFEILWKQSPFPGMWT